MGQCSWGSNCGIALCQFLRSQRSVLKTMQIKPGRKQTVVVHRADNREKPPLNTVIFRWFVTVGVCLSIWTVLSPLFYEGFYGAAARTGDFTGWLFWFVCFAFPLLLVSISSTRKVMVKTRDQYFPPANTDNADLPLGQTLVRASSEPMQAQEAVLLRAAEGQETPPDELVRPAELE